MALVFIRVSRKWDFFAQMLQLQIIITKGKEADITSSEKLKSFDLII